jgi:hypothetical protein
MKDMFMKKILFIIIAAAFSATSCSDIDFEIDELYEMAEISGITLYDETAVNVIQESEIDADAATITAIVKSSTDITRLKLVLSVSQGAKVTPSASVGFQDLSEPQVCKVTSPNGKITKEWTISVSYPLAP